jgi:hypothetical protein
MILRDKIVIDRPAEDVWRFIQSPALMKKWNPKVKTVVSVSRGDPAAGYRYRVRYEINGRESNYLAEFMEYQDPLKLLIHLSGGNLPVKGYILEIYELTENTGKTLLKQRIEIHNSGMNIFSRFRLLCSHSFARISKGKHLSALKKLVETA